MPEDAGRDGAPRPPVISKFGALFVKGVFIFFPVKVPFKMAAWDHPPRGKRQTETHTGPTAYLYA